MRSSIALCAGAFVLSGCGATAASQQVQFAGQSRRGVAVARVEQARVVVDPVACSMSGTRLAKGEPSKDPVTEEPPASDDMWSESIDDVSSSGLALSGVGEGGGGLAGGIGYDGIGTLGDGSYKGAPEVVAHAQTDLGREEGVIRSPRPVAAGAHGRVAARFVMDRSGGIAPVSEGASAPSVVATLAGSAEVGATVQPRASVDRTVRRVAYGSHRRDREDF